MYRLILCGLFLFGAFSFSVRSQGILDSIPVVELEGRSQELVRALTDLYRYKVSYDYKLLPDRIDSVKSDSATLKILLKYLFREQKVRFRLIDDVLTIYQPSDSLPGQIENPASDTCLTVTLSGTIVDELTQGPIAYASVFYHPTRQFAITNKDGYFKLTLHCADTSESATLYAWGYKNGTLPINRPVPDPVVLKGDYITLQDVVVLSVDPIRTVKESLKSIQTNYQDQPTVNRSFFREVITKNRKLVAVSEGVLDIYKSSYTDSSPDQVQLVKGRKFINTERLDTIFLKVKGSINSCLELDIVKRRPFFYNLSTFENDYIYSYEGITKFNENRVYKISFTAREDSPTTPFVGTLYINKLNHSLEAVEFSVDPARTDEAQAAYVIKKNLGIRIQLKGADYTVQYLKTGDKYVLNYVRLEVDFKVKRSKELFASNYETVSEMILTHFKASDFDRIPRKETAVSNKILLDQPIKFDPDFWKDHNYLPFSESLIENMEQLNLILEE